MMCQFRSAELPGRGVVKRASSYNVLLLLKGELPSGRSAKSEAHASLNWSHLLALVGVSADKCLSAGWSFSPTPSAFASVNLRDRSILDDRDTGRGRGSVVRHTSHILNLNLSVLVVQGNCPGE